MAEISSYVIRAHFDEASRTYYTDGEDFPGLYVEAKSFDDLVQRIGEVIPDLIAASRELGLAAGQPAGSRQVTVSVTAERHSVAHIAA